MIQQAIVLTSAEMPDDFEPTTARVAGLSMLKRTLAMLKWAGVHETFIVVGAPAPGDDRSPAARYGVEGDREIVSGEMRVRWVEDEGAAERGGLALAPVAGQIRGRVLIVRSDTVYDRDIVRDMVTGPVPADRVRTVVDGDELIGLSVCHASAVTALNGHTIRAGFDAFDALGRIDRVDIGDRFWVRIEDASSIERAEALLWNSCRKPHDGIVARLLNRHVSLFISRRIAHLPISPNHVSIVTFLLGILTAISVSQGTYVGFVLGAALFKLNSILDGVDGELARVKYKMSVTGEWLDTLSDDMSSVLFYAGLAVGAYRMTGDQLWASLGLATVVMFLLVTSYYYTLLIRHGRGDVLAVRFIFERGNGKGDGESSAFSAFMDKLKLVVKKDFFVLLVLVMAIAGVLPWVLFLTTLANAIVVITIVANEIILARLQRNGEYVERVVTGAAATVPTEAVPNSVKARPRREAQTVVAGR